MQILTTDGGQPQSQTAHAFRGAPQISLVVALIIRIAAPFMLMFGIGAAFNGPLELFAFVPLLVPLVWEDKWAEWSAFIGGSFARMVVTNE